MTLLHVLSVAASAAAPLALIIYASNQRPKRPTHAPTAAERLAAYHAARVLDETHIAREIRGYAYLRTLHTINASIPRNRALVPLGPPRISHPRPVTRARAKIARRKARATPAARAANCKRSSK